MAIYHLAAKVFSRADGHTAVAAAAYRSGSRLTCERDGITHDYSRRMGVAFSEIVLPEHAPRRWLDRQVLWNEVEAVERSPRAHLCREVEVALPRELTREEQIALARWYAQSFVDENMVCDWALHDKGDGNPHAHLLLALRPSTEGGFGPKTCNAYLVRNSSGEDREATAAELKELGPEWQKVYKYKNGRQLTQAEASEAGLHPTKDRKSKAPIQVARELTDWNTVGKLREWRKRWADYANDALEASGSDERLDHRSFEELGIELIPTLHEGSNIAAIERKAKERAEREGYEYVPVTDRRRINTQIKLLNDWLRGVAKMITELMLSRLEQAKTRGSKRTAQRYVRRAKPRTKRPYAPRRGRRVSPSGGMSK